MADGTQALASARNDAPERGGEGEARGRPLAERQIEALGELVDIGLKLARAIERRVDGADGEPASVADLNAAAIAFARVARAVRQTIMLQSRLDAERGAAAAKARDRRARVSCIVRGVVEDECDDREQVERLCAEAAEGLEQERWGDVLARPVGEVVANICKALGLSPDWRALADDIREGEAFAGGAADAAAQPGYRTPIDVRWLGEEDEAPEPAHPGEIDWKARRLGTSRTWRRDSG